MDTFEVEMMDIVFTRYHCLVSYRHSLIQYYNFRMIGECRKKCIPGQYQDGELNKGEAVCARRCGAKLLAAVELISTQLAAQQQQAK